MQIKRRQRYIVNEVQIESLVRERIKNLLSAN